MSRSVPVILVVAVLGLLAWAKAKFELDARVTAFTEGMRHEVLRASETPTGMPDEAMVRSRVAALAVTHELEASEVSFSTAEMGSAGAGPASEAARRVAGQLGEGQVQRYEGETFDGRPIVTTRSTQLHATVATLRVHVHGTKWLWSVDATPEVHKTFDFHF
ncbi:MAG: hypothetical protein U0230_10395 [Polyangiales bacterium]